MQTRYRRLARLSVGVAAVAAAAVALPVAVNAQPVGSPAAGSLTLTPSVGTSSTPLALEFSTLPQNCQGNGDAGYRVETFIVPAIADPATIVYAASGAPASALQSDGTPVPAGAFMASLRATTGTQLRHGFPDFVDFAVDSSFTSSIGFQATAAPAGNYKIGLACVLATETTRFWSLDVAVAPSAGAGPMNYIIGVPAAPAAPALTTVSNVLATSATVNFTHADSLPATTGYTATVTGGAFDPIAPIAAGATSFPLTGLTTNTPYTVTLVANNPVGASAVSNSVTFTPSASPQPSIPATLTPGVGEATISFNAPVAGVGGFTAVPTSYTLNVSPPPASPGLASYPIPAALGTITQVVQGLTAGTPYTFTLVPTYAAPNSGPSTVVTGTVNSAQVVQQRITVIRPVGQLILTQRCGVHGDLPTLPGVSTFPGFPGTLPNLTATGDQIGTTPDIDPVTDFPIGGVPADDVDPDPQFGNYPFPTPASYSTECGVDLGTATIVNDGSTLSGQYYQASGFINEITISDLRDTDLGWEVRGQMSDFTGTASATNVIDGDYLGWNPVIQDFTGPSPTYGGQTVTAGTGVLPGTGITAATTGQGLGTGRRLAQAAENAGLGVAQMDARLRLLIPTSANNDTYIGILNFTVLDNDNGVAP